jgi:hypothetical protein
MADHYYGSTIIIRSQKLSRFCGVVSVCMGDCRGKLHSSLTLAVHSFTTFIIICNPQCRMNTFRQRCRVKNRCNET